MALKIETGDKNEILRKVSEPVKTLDKNIKKLIKSMLETLKNDKNAVGLAAPQVGMNIRVIVVFLNDRCLAMINPKIYTQSSETNIDEEGCLSIPGEFGNVERATHISLEFFNEKLQKKKLDLSEFDARIILHEIDHLDGILFPDRMTESQLSAMHSGKVTL